MFQVDKMGGGKRPIIGAVRVNKPFTFHDNHYECAAWYEDHQATNGVHPIRLERSYHDPQQLLLTAEIKAQVVDDYFAGLFGGVPISKEPYTPKHIGEARVIRRGIDVMEAIEATGNLPGNDIDIFVHPSWWKVFADEALTKMQEDYRSLPEFWDAFANLREETFQSTKSCDYRFDDEYRFKVGMIAHFGAHLEKWARRLEKINWSSQYHTENGRYNTTYNRENFDKNMEWAKAIAIQVHE